MTVGASDSPQPQPDDTEGADGAPDSRLKLVWDVVVFQLKLTADGLRDVVLVPVSLIAAVMGLVAGGSDPAVYFRRVLQFGRRTEVWINLFGFRRHAATSDAMLKPLEDKLLDQAQNNPLLQKAGTQINRSLDNINDRVSEKRDPDA